MAAYPELISIQTIGQSTEGRDIKVLKISTGGSNKTAFWIDSSKATAYSQLHKLLCMVEIDAYRVQITQTL